MSHVYSFAFMNMFIYYLRQYFIFFKRKHLLLLSIILGIIVLIRPINGMILFIIPFVAGNYTNLKNGIKKIDYDGPISGLNAIEKIIKNGK